MNRAVWVMVTGLCVMALTPLAAQQAAGVAPTAGVNTPPPVSSSNTAQSGPRLQPELRRFEASVSDSSTAARVAPRNYSGGGATITLSTLALVLVVVIIVLLVVK